MLHEFIVGGVSVLTLIIATAPTHAQRGAGDSDGIARQSTRPKMIRIEGRLSEVKTGPCDLTTGRAGIGTHLVLRTYEGAKVYLHLGPAGFVQPYVYALEPGQMIVADAFRTERLHAIHYVAVRLVLGDQEILLRDESLRPAWAGGGRFWGREAGGRCPYGRDRGGRGYGYRWSYEVGVDGGLGYGRQAHGVGLYQYWAMPRW